MKGALGLVAGWEKLNFIVFYYLYLEATAFNRYFLVYLLSGRGLVFVLVFRERTN